MSSIGFPLLSEGIVVIMVSVAIYWCFFHRSKPRNKDRQHRYQVRVSSGPLAPFPTRKSTGRPSYRRWWLPGCK